MNALTHSYLKNMTEERTEEQKQDIRRYFEIKAQFCPKAYELKRDLARFQIAKKSLKNNIEAVNFYSELIEIRKKLLNDSEAPEGWIKAEERISEIVKAFQSLGGVNNA